MFFMKQEGHTSECFGLKEIKKKKKKKCSNVFNREIQA